MNHGLIAVIISALVLNGCGDGRVPQAGTGEAEDGLESWVTVDRLNLRTCPDTSCGIVGQLFFREIAIIYEERNGWGRITPYSALLCEDGIHDYVDSGNAACNEANGVIDGHSAEWVSLEYLSAERPPDPAEGAVGYHALVGGSTDYRIHGDAFARAAEELIKAGRCTRRDFEELGAWTKDPFRPNEPVYFTYCGGLTRQHMLHLNAATGEILR
jgi:hypothetical protein